MREIPWGLVLVGCDRRLLSKIVAARRCRQMRTVMQTLTSADGNALRDEAGKEIQAPLRQQSGESINVYDDPVVQNIDIFDFAIPRAVVKEIYETAIRVFLRKSEALKPLK